MLAKYRDSADSMGTRARAGCAEKLWYANGDAPTRDLAGRYEDPEFENGLSKVEYLDGMEFPANKFQQWPSDHLVNFDYMSLWTPSFLY